MYFAEQSNLLVNLKSGVLKMLPVCLKCSSKLSMSWFLCSLVGTKTRCVNCGALHKFTNWHKLTSSLCALIVVFGMQFFESCIPWTLVLFFSLCLLCIVISINIPGQYKLESQDKLKIK